MGYVLGHVNAPLGFGGLDGNPWMVDCFAWTLS